MKTLPFPKIERDLREGRGLDAKAQLESLSAGSLAREEIATFAGLARRANSHSLALRVLHPLVRSADAVDEALDSEKAEYAASLCYVGATEEALGILHGLDGKDHPQVFLFRAYAHMARWDYDASLPELKACIRHPEIDPYLRIVAKVNLCSALVHERRDEKATASLRELMHETSLKRYRVLHANVHEIAAQNFLHLRRPKEARKCLERAEKTLAGSGILDELFVAKWKAYLDVHDTKGSPPAMAGLAAFREKAAAAGVWETVRDCDRFEATYWTDEKIFLRLFFGTPYEGFRRTLRREFARKIEIPRAYPWQMNGPASRDAVYDFLSGRGKSLKVGQLLHRLAMTLASDFYRPFRVANLHYCLYPNEFFHPVTSRTRVYEAVKRLRDWLETESLPFEVAELEGAYRLVAKGPCALLVPHHEPEGGKKTILVQRLREKWKDQPFTAAEAGRDLGLTGSTVLRLLKEEVAKGRLTRSGKRRAAKYSFITRL